ncbi:MAG: leucine-rich repeat protein [Clostridia bacterium]|nr:leucine-rich repeat protein [Clostridia bacterium]
MKIKLSIFISLFICLLSLTFAVGCGEPSGEEPPVVDPNLEIFSYTETENGIVIYDFKDRNYSSELEEVFIPKCVNVIGSEALISAYNAKRIVFEEGSNLVSIKEKAFRNCFSLEEITIPSSVKHIESNAFERCINLTKATLPSSLEEVGANLFNGCEAVIVYCESQKNPSGWASDFNSSRPIVWNSKTNNLAEDGREYALINGVRYSLSNGEAYVERQIQQLKRAEIPSTISYNGNNYAVTKICDRAFYECVYLNYATIPTTVKNIGVDSFLWCYELLEITYLGSIDDWVSIDFDGPVLQNGVGLRINGEIANEIKITTATKISKNAFGDYFRLTKIEIPSTVTEIGEGAFYNCNRAVIYCEDLVAQQGWLDDFGDVRTVIWNYKNNDVATDGYVYTNVGGVNYVIIEGGAYITAQNENITALNIPKQITYKNQNYNVLGTTQEDVFMYLYNLGEVYFEGDADEWLSLEINESPFYYVESFYLSGKLVEEITITIKADMSKSGNFSYYRGLKKVTVEEGVIAFRGVGYCENLTEITLPSTLTYFAGVSGCSSLESIVIPANVESIGSSAFSECHNLKSITIENGSKLDRIGGYAFERCERLTSITIPKSVKSLGQNLFYVSHNVVVYCEAPEEGKEWNKNWNYDGNPVVWDCKNNDVADDGYIYTNIDGFTYSIKDGVATLCGTVSGVEHFEIPSQIEYKNEYYTVTTIKKVILNWDDRFSLVSVVIPDTVTEIKTYAFGDLENLQGVTISLNSKLESIGESCFSFCKKLTEIYIPNTVSYIGNRAFNACEVLTIYCALSEKQDEWGYYWNECYELLRCPVIWNYQG